MGQNHRSPDLRARAYVRGVREGLFPSGDHVYHVIAQMEDFEKIFQEFMPEP